MEWKFRPMAGVAAGVLALMVPVGAARAEEPVAPRVAAIFNRLFDEAILVDGYGSWESPAPEPLRTAQPLVEPVRWFGAASALVAARHADPQASLYTALLLDITPEGTIAACRYSPNGSKPVDEAVLCREIAGQRFLPQLADDGTPVRGKFRLGLSSRSFPAAPGDPPRPLFTAERDIRPAPMLAPSAERLERFPPSNSEVYSLYLAPQWKTAPQPGWGETAQAGPMTGLILINDRNGTVCRVLAPSGDPQADAAACAYSKETLAPDWYAIGGSRGLMVPLTILHRPEGFLAIGPDPDRVLETRMADGAEDALVAALIRAGVLGKDRAKSPLVLDLAANPDGSVRHCRVVRTTGGDAADIAACRIARETVRLMPFEDVFGTPNPLASLFWGASSAAR